jgi:predicted O-methyltransferase YrrM
MQSPYKYVGDLSKADARLLVAVASKCSSILEFGVGGSTMLFAQAMPLGGELVCVDTDGGWIERTVQKITTLGAPRPKFFCGCAPEPHWVNGQVDFVFIDGADAYRRSFALAAWSYLKPGGSMGFHDTRRIGDIDNVQALIRANFESVGASVFNANDSNITLIHKRMIAVPYENWHDVEGKQRWQSGYEEAPVDWLENAPTT